MTDIEIKQKLPHRWPFLHVDRVTKISKQAIEGYKNVSASEIAFLGHFEEISIFPGVLIIEALAQLSGLFLSGQGDMQPDGGGGGKIGFLTGVRGMKFLKTVHPGDQLFLKSLLKGNSGDCHVFSVSAFVDNTQVATGEIQIFLQEKDAVL